jgi:(p)ppGpp synthase/HD superfamily hydrolase
MIFLVNESEFQTAHWHIRSLSYKHIMLLSENSGINYPPVVSQANNLRAMLLGMVDDPRVVLIKLADRLHNMRTMYVILGFSVNFLYT